MRIAILTEKNALLLFAILGWDAVPNAIRYQVQGKIKNSPFGISRFGIVTNNSFRTNNLFPFLTYRWRVRTDCPGEGYTAWSEWQEFTLNPFLYLNAIPYTGTRDLEVVDLFDVDRIVTIYPNPSKGIVDVHYMGMNLENVELLVTDIAGQFVNVKKVELQTRNSIKIDLTSCDNGIYFINLYKDGVHL